MPGRISGFAPLSRADARVLILGSVPSVASIEKHQYYGKSQNAFWRIMGALFAAGPELGYDERAQRLTREGVAVWDVIAECVRPGSLDSAIDMQTVVVNNFAVFFDRHPMISHVFFNGRKSEDVYRRRVLCDVEELRPSLRYISLPSTSPAMAMLDFNAKLMRWEAVRNVLQATPDRM